MNGETPSVPITTLAGIASLTDLLPELPVAGPSPAGPTCPSSNYLYHNTISEESGHLLSRPNDALASQLGIALASTTVDHVMLNAKNMSAFSQQGQQQPVMTTNTSHLQGALFRRDQTLFTPLNRQQQVQVQQQQLRWNNNGGGTTTNAAVSASSTPNMDPNYSPNYGHHSPASTNMPQSGFNQQQQQNMYNMQGAGGYNTNQFGGYNQQQQQHMISNNASGSGSGSGAQHLQQQHQTPQQQHPPQQQHSGLSHGQSPLQQQQHSQQQQQQQPQQQSNSQQQLPHQQQQHSSTNGEMATAAVSSQKTSSLRDVRRPHQQQQEVGHKQEVQQTPPKPQQQTTTPMQQEQMNHVGDSVTQPKVEVKTEVKPVVPSLLGGNKNNPVPVVPSLLGKNNVMKPTLMLSKLSKEDEELMQKSLKLYAKENPQRAQDLGVTDQRGQIKSSRSRIQSKYSDGADSDSDSDEENSNEPKKLKSKFFRATEKERDEQKRVAKEERRKRKYEDGGFDGAGDGAGHVGKRRRKEDTPEPEEADFKPFVPKKQTRKVERKLIPMIMKINPADLNESGIASRFNEIVDKIFEDMEMINLQELEANSIANDGNIEMPPEIIINKYNLRNLAEETAKLKSMGAMETISVERLIKLLTILELNIRDGSKVIPLAADDDDDEDIEESKLYLDMAMERVVRAADASLTVLNIMTSKKMPKPVYLDDVIDRVALLLRFQLQNTIYPSFDPIYREISKSKTGYVGSMKKKRSYAHSVRDKNILSLYNKVTEMTSMLAELVKIQTLTDTSVLHISTLGVAPFFVESIPELQLAALKLVTNVFSKYEKHRKLLLDDILASIARLPSSKRSLRTYRLNSNTHIQMLTALVLQLIQCVVVLPKKLALKDEKGLLPPENKGNKEEPEVVQVEENTSQVDRDVLINDKYSMAMGTAHQFITVFLKKCATKSEDIDYRPLFENFIQDLLQTVNTPEWPAAELLLSLLGRVLREKFTTRSTEMTLRLSSLEYLGTVASRLRRDAVQSKLRIDYIDSIVSAIREEENKEDTEEVESTEKNSKNNKNNNSKKKKKDEAVTEEDKETERTMFLQRVLLDYLAVNGGETDQAMMNARHFYIGQWYRDANVIGKATKVMRKKKSKKKSSDSSEEDSDESEEEENEEDDLPDSAKAELFRLREERKDFLVKKILPFGVNRGNKAQVLSTHIDQHSALLIVKYLSSKRPFANSFNQYLADILFTVSEQSTQIRTKALKCMTMIVTEDPDVLLKDSMQQAVQYSLKDVSTMVREAAVDLIGRFILHKQELIVQYYGVITDRILDTGVSVRKRVIKILKDICLEFPTYDKIPEICVKMIRRINDEEGIRKLVMDVFQNMWFVPLPRHPSPEDKELLVTKAMNITDVVVACRETGLEWFEQLLDNIFRPKEDKDDSTKKNTEASPHLVLACQQIVDCLIESVLRMEESSVEMMDPASNSTDPQNQNNNSAKAKGASNRLVACLTTLYLFAKSRPNLLVEHVQTLAPYLSVTVRTKSDQAIISYVARTLELTVPLIKHPSEIFLSQLEESSVKLILLYDKKVMEACLSCLGSVVNDVTKNFKLIRDCFNQYFGWMSKFKEAHEKDPEDSRLPSSLPRFRRAMFTVGLLLRHFDFKTAEVYEGLEYGENTVEEVFRHMFYFMRHRSRQIQVDALQAIGYLCIRHHKFMMENKLKTIYIDILSTEYYPVEHKTKVLNNIELFLVEEEAQMIKMDKKWKDYQEKENLKEMGDVSSGMASTVIQVYLKAILNAFLHEKYECRTAGRKVISIIYGQGLVNPAMIVDYLICMATDPMSAISHAADRDLQEIEKKYPGFIHMKLLHGIRLSFRLQQIVQNDKIVVRGYRVKNEGELPSAMNGYLYSIMRNTKSQRRAILMNLLKQFDETSKNSLTYMLYLADNLAYIPYTVLDEPLFVIHHIDIQISVSGSNLLQTFKECLKPPPSCEQRFNLETGKTEYIYDEDLDDDEKSVFERLPDDLRPLQEAITAAQGCNLLLVLREHLKDFYGLTTTKLSQYSPSDTSKAFDRAVTRRSNVKFNPKQTIQLLKLGEPKEWDDEQKLDLVKKYMDFKELMNKIDPDDDEDEDGNPIDRMAISNLNPLPTKQSYRVRGQDLVKSGMAKEYQSQQAKLDEIAMSEAMRLQQQQQQKYQDMQNHPLVQKLRPQRTSGTSTPQKSSRDHHHSTTTPQKSSSRSHNHNDNYNYNSNNSNSMAGMRLDPMTGEMVPITDDEDEQDDGDVHEINENPVVIKLGNLTKKSDNSTQGSRVPTLKINLGPRIDTTTTGSSNGGLSGSSKKHHHHHKHHRKHKKSKKKKHIDSDDDDDIVELSNGSDEDYRV